MSVGPPALGNVLVQRLDAVLGTTMAAHANTLTGARADAVGQPGQTARTGQTDDATRDPRRQVGATPDQAGRQAAVVDAKTAAALALAARGLVTSRDTTASAPTTLGNTARIILSLLAQYPGAAPAAQGASALWTPPDPARGNAAQAAPAPSAEPQPDEVENAAVSAPPGRPAQIAPSASGAAAGPLPSAAAFAQALRQSLQTSGLFYESHLTDMVYGQRAPEALRAEPQAALPPPPAAPTPNAVHGRAGAAASPASVPSGSAVLSLSAQAEGASAQEPGAPVAGLHPQTNALVRQQLEILANHVVHWQGQPWPGADMDWELRRDPYGEAPQDPDSHWASRLTLHLPRLGEIEARLSLAGSQLVLQLTAPQSAGELKQAAAALRQQLSGAGLTLSDLSVQAVAPPPVQIPDFLLPDA
ncbi:flagellar hook-length control protein FliK [Bordetella genomosp. 12]|uniref:Flagellar hook-length control protein FliK n=1 Tax=Bordetella genomosp. 12 TaxID=463035 RepID=A0A261VLI1_9BORD|nr:flagellar hook-length control protein FliK [Bordetella genomosp. 12]OZI74697.1 flagellar hook-length control protein FliK [Bordetella genomosp. 12]